MSRISQSLAVVSALLVATVATAGCGGLAPKPDPAGAAGQVKIGLITKNSTNTYFLKMKEGAQLAADAGGAELITAAGHVNVDVESQAAAIDNMIAAGVKGILIVPNDAKAIVPSIRKARDRGILVIALDTATDPMDAVDAFIGTDNLKAAQLLGRYTRAALAGKPARIAMLDSSASSKTGRTRHEGFLQGFGIADGDPSIVCQQFTQSEKAKAQAAMRDCLASTPGINVVYTVNEPVAFAAAYVLKSQRRDSQAIVASFDGGCTGVRGVELGEITVTAQQYPLEMARRGVEAILDHARTGARPAGVTDTGVTLVTNRPLPGIDSKDTEYGRANCWGV